MKLLILLAAMSAQTLWDMNPQAVREAINKRILSIDAPIPTVYSTEDRIIDAHNTPIRIYRPNEKGDLPIILMIHGGAWVGGNLDTHDNLARVLCSEVEAIVVSVGYLNAPEGKYPLPLEQCYDALLFARGLSSSIAVVGDSAGGNMSAALTLLTRDRKGPQISFQVLINPATDLSCGGSLERTGEDFPDIVRWNAVQYVKDPADANLPYVSPLLATNLENLPPALIILGEEDPFKPFGQQYANRLQEAGIPTQVYCQSGVGHLAGDGARVSERARPSIDAAVQALKKVFAP